LGVWWEEKGEIWHLRTTVSIECIALPEAVGCFEMSAVLQSSVETQCEGNFCIEYSYSERYKHYKKLITRWEYQNMTWRTSSYLFTYLRLSIDMHWIGSSPIMYKVNLKFNWRHLNLNLTLQNTYSTLMCGLRIFAVVLVYVNRISAS